jgi:hypothetical protein
LAARRPALSVFAVLSLSWGEVVAVVVATTMSQAPPR